MDLKEIDKLIDKLTAKGITEFELEREGFRIRICKNAPVIVSNTAVEATPAELPIEVTQEAKVEPEVSEIVETKTEEKPQPSGSDNLHVITSPMVGTFYRSPSPGAKPYVELGDRVKKGQVCCIVEAMKLMNEILIDFPGVVNEIHVENAQPVEFGEPLFTIEKSR